jgi:hypothetical protein
VSATPAPAPQRSAAQDARSASGSRYLAWIGPVAGVVAGQAPQALGLFGLALGGRAVTGTALSPSLQLTPLWGKTGVTGPLASGGEFAWAVGRLEGCPVSLVLSASARLDPCLALEVGRLTARGADVDVPVSAERWWVAPGTTLSLHLGFRGWFVRAGGMALFPATRDEFVFRQPNRTVHQADPGIFGVNVSFGIQLGE